MYKSNLLLTNLVYSEFGTNRLNRRYRKCCGKILCFKTCSDRANIGRICSVLNIDSSSNAKKVWDDWPSESVELWSIWAIFLSCDVTRVLSYTMTKIDIFKACSDLSGIQNNNIGPTDAICDFIVTFYHFPLQLCVWAKLSVR